MLTFLPSKEAVAERLVMDSQIETIRVNVLGMLNLADICLEKGIHLTTYATGCIYHYDKDFPQGSGKGFTELDPPNFTGSYYSYTKVQIPVQVSLIELSTAKESSK